MSQPGSVSPPPWPARLLMVGCGNMGGAMLAGWLAAGIPADRFTVVDPRLPETPRGVELLREPPTIGDWDALLLGIKPQYLNEAAPALTALAGRNTIVLSIMAGVEMASLAARFPQAGGVVRIMPNLAAAIGKSPVALVGQGITGAQRDAVAALMAPLGMPEWLADEALLDAVTALVGSGPAFVYRFIAALAEGGVSIGLPRDQAGRMALAMVEGAGALAAVSPHAPGELARRVASPGGTTEAGLEVLDKGDALARLVAETLRAASDRGAQMAEAARG